MVKDPAAPEDSASISKASSFRSQRRITGITGSSSASTLINSDAGIGPACTSQNTTSTLFARAMSRPASVRAQVVTRADEYSVLATPNLNGDYISDACAAQVGGLGIAPGANIGDGYAIFEATHGTAPKYADKDVINPGSVILSGVMMFRHLGWNEAADLIEQSMERTIEQKKVTYDFERLMPGATKVKTSEFASSMIENMGAGVLV